MHPNKNLKKIMKIFTTDDLKKYRLQVTQIVEHCTHMHTIYNAYVV